MLKGCIARGCDDALGSVSSSTFLATFQTNDFGPLLLTQALLLSVLKARNPKLASMSSRIGSIAENTGGGANSYHASKTTLNTGGKSMTMDLKDKGVVVLLLHPGFVVSGLAKSDDTKNHPEAVMPEEAAQKLRKVIKSKGIADTGTF